MRTLLTTLVITTSLLACPAKSNDLARAIHDTNTIAADFRKNESFSGVWAVFRNGEPMVQLSMGFANVENQVPMKNKSVMPIGSNSKLFTAVALYQLQEQGKVNLSQPINTFLDRQDFANFGFPNQSVYCPQAEGQSGCHNMTFTQLLAMTSGIPDVISCVGLSPNSSSCHLDQFYGYYNGSIAHYVGLFINEPLHFTPGTKFQYSNPNFILVSYLIEKISGLSLQEYFQKNILDRLGLRDTYYDPYDGEYRTIKNYADQYMWFFDVSTMESIATGACHPSFPSGSISGSGGLLSTVDDLARWYLDLFGNYGKNSQVLSADSIQQLVKPWIRMPDQEDPNTFFTQGLMVTYANGTASDNKSSSAWPSSIHYCGSTVCAHTCIEMKFGAISAAATPNAKPDTIITAAFSNQGLALVANHTVYQAMQHGPPVVFQSNPLVKFDENAAEIRDWLTTTWSFSN